MGGGTITTIRPAPGPYGDKGTLVKVRGAPADYDWAYHTVVVKGGRVYDAITGEAGETIEEYKERFEYGDDIDFDF